MNDANPTIITIYVPLLGEGTPVIRPVNAEVIERDICKILPLKNSETERWKYPPGAIVQHVAEEWGGKKILVAKRIISYQNGSNSG